MFTGGRLDQFLHAMIKVVEKGHDLITPDLLYDEQGLSKIHGTLYVPTASGTVLSMTLKSRRAPPAAKHA